MKTAASVQVEKKSVDQPVPCANTDGLEQFVKALLDKGFEGSKSEWNVCPAAGMAQSIKQFIGVTQIQRFLARAGINTDGDS